MPDLEIKNTETDKKNLWAQILSDVQNNGNPKLPSCKQVLVLGDNESGKTTIVAKLQGVEDPKKGCGLEYAYIDVRDDYRDDQTRLSVWILDGDPGHTDLLKFALNEETFQHTLVILTVSMTSPWSILEQLQHWSSVLADHLDKLNLDVDQRQQRRQFLIKIWQDYIEPGDELDPSSPMKRSSRTFTDGIDDNNDDTASLSEGTLTNNLGLEIVVVVTKRYYSNKLSTSYRIRLCIYCKLYHDIWPRSWARFLHRVLALFSYLKMYNKCLIRRSMNKATTLCSRGMANFETDYMQTLEKEHDYRDEHLDFMQQWIRKFCLQYGAALFYTSAKEDKNCDLLYKYLTHRIYNFPFRTPALVVEKDAVFIPAGWDNMNKIRILYENLHSCKADDYYRDVIVQPTTRKAINREVEILAEDEQAFLARQQQILFAGAAHIPARLGEPQIRSSPLSKGALDGSKVVGSPGGEGVLANFFNSLLHKKTGSTPNNSLLNKSGGSGGGGDSFTEKSSMRSDAAAELDRLARGGKKPSSSSSSGSGPASGVDFNASDC